MHFKLKLGSLEIQGSHSLVQYPSLHHYWADPGLWHGQQSERGPHSSGRGGRGVYIRNVSGVGSPWSDGHHSAESRRAFCRGPVQSEGKVLGATAGKEGSQRIPGFRSKLSLQWGREQNHRAWRPVLIDTSFNCCMWRKNHVRCQGSFQKVWSHC